MSEMQVKREAAAHALVWDRMVGTSPWPHLVAFRKRNWAQSGPITLQMTPLGHGHRRCRSDVQTQAVGMQPVDGSQLNHEPVVDHHPRECLLEHRSRNARDLVEMTMQRGIRLASRHAIGTV